MPPWPIKEFKYNVETTPHTSVLLEELVNAMKLGPSSVAIDCTVGAGGHTEAILQRVVEGQVIGIDRDETALTITRQRLAGALEQGRLLLYQAPFSDLAMIAKKAGVFGQVDGICADIGVSSMHLDEADRGFSFQREGPLDMRMDRTSGQPASCLVNEASEQELADIFYRYGEEPKSRLVARKIAQARANQEITSTLQLAEIVKQALPYQGKSKKHPATKVFQALRIAVNDELGELERLIQDAYEVLKPGGRLAIISFHSLEDRIVKNAFLDLTARRERSQLPRNLPIRDEQMQQMVKQRANIIKPFPLTPSDEETQRNSRARSAKLRVFEKTTELS